MLELGSGICLPLSSVSETMQERTSPALGAERGGLDAKVALSSNNCLLTQFISAETQFLAPSLRWKGG